VPAFDVSPELAHIDIEQMALSLPLIVSEGSKHLILGDLAKPVLSYEY